MSAKASKTSASSTPAKATAPKVASAKPAVTAPKVTSNATPAKTSTPKVASATPKSNGTPSTTSSSSKPTKTTTTTTTTTTSTSKSDNVNKKRTWAQVFTIPDFKTNFCNDCGTLLDISAIKKSDTVTCEICGGATGRKDLIEKTIITKSKIGGHAASEPEDDGEESNGATIDEKCPQCGNVGLFFTTAQTRSADEGQTVFYKCKSCGHKFTQNN